MKLNHIIQHTLYIWNNYCAILLFLCALFTMSLFYDFLFSLFHTFWNFVLSFFSLLLLHCLLVSFLQLNYLWICVNSNVVVYPCIKHTVNPLVRLVCPYCSSKFGSENAPKVTSILKKKKFPGKYTPIPPMQSDMCLFY